MTYRDPSFDPELYTQPGAPIRPFNAVQWAGVALGSVGLALTLAGILDNLGMFDREFDAAPYSFLALFAGVALINTRRHPDVTVGPEQRARNRRVLVITLAICAVVFAAALLAESLGA